MAGLSRLRKSKSDSWVIETATCPQWALSKRLFPSGKPGSGFRSVPYSATQVLRGPASYSVPKGEEI